MLLAVNLLPLTDPRLAGPTNPNFG